MVTVEDFETLKALLKDMYEYSFELLRKYSDEQDKCDDPDNPPTELTYKLGHAMGQNETISALYLAVFGGQALMAMWDESIHRWDSEYGED